MEYLVRSSGSAGSGSPFPHYLRGVPQVLPPLPGEVAILDGGIREFYESPEKAWEPFPGGASGEYRYVRYNTKYGNFALWSFRNGDRAVLAMALTYRYKSEPKSATMDTALRLSDSKGKAFARRLGACLRLAYNLSGGAPGLLPQIALRRTDRDLRLVVPAELPPAQD